MNKELIDFAIYLTGHDEDTIRQMYADWVRFESTKLESPESDGMIKYTQ